MGEKSSEDSHGDVSAYTTDGVTVYYDKSRCIHSGECVRGLPQVFDTKQQPWVQPGNADAEAVAEAIHRCPSGALQYELADGPDEQPETPTRIDPQIDGPLYVRGDLRIALDEGLLTDTRAALCRCGRSGNKPFCDKTCERSGWSSTWHPPADE
ncbi:MAG: (4Fe-4S)-binding protein [Actinobacteria bacterium]|nr:(4Fe-4S)-binding protein [Actinomycetota bacterium]